jgi:hypothetical protein
MKQNIHLHQELVSLVVDSEEIAIGKSQTRSIPSDLLRLQMIIDEQIPIGLQSHHGVAVRSLAADMGQEPEKSTPELIRHVRDAVMHCCGSDGASSVNSKLEKALLTARAEELEKAELCDTVTLRCSRDDIENRYRRLMEEKMMLIAQIEKIRHEQVSTAKMGISRMEEFNITNARLDAFRDIVSKKGAELRRILEENKMSLGDMREWL